MLSPRVSEWLQVTACVRACAGVYVLGDARAFGLDPHSAVRLCPSGCGPNPSHFPKPLDHLPTTSSQSPLSPLAWPPPPAHLVFAPSLAPPAGDRRYSLLLGHLLSLAPVVPRHEQHHDDQEAEEEGGDHTHHHHRGRHQVHLLPGGILRVCQGQASV